MKLISDRLKNGEKPIGTFLNLGSQTAAECVAIAGMDYFIVDLEHSPFGLAEAADCIRMAKLKGISPLVRIPEISRANILKQLDVGAEGNITAAQVEEAIRPDTCLVTAMFANNEIGSILPIAEIGEVCRAHGVLFHTDAVQAAGHIPVNVKKQNIDMLSLSAHKFHGPRGIGALYVKRGIELTSLMEGGGQERGKRPGTENLPAIMGMAAALKEECALMEENAVKVTALRERLIQGLSQIPYSILNGPRDKRLPGNVNFCFEGVSGESLLLLLDGKGICASSGSACASGALDPSHVLLALGLTPEIAQGSLRISLDISNTEEEIDYMLEVISQVVEHLRVMSDDWQKKHCSK